MKVEKTTDLKKVLAKLKNVFLNDTRTAIEYDEEGIIIRIENLNSSQQKSRLFAIHNKENNDGLQITFDHNEKLSINENDIDIICSIVSKYEATKDFSYLSNLMRFVGSVFDKTQIRFKTLKTANINNFDPITQLQEEVYYYYTDKEGSSKCLKLKGEFTHKVASYSLNSGQPFKCCFVYIPPQTYNGTKCTVIDPISGTNIDTDNIFKALLNVM